MWLWIALALCACVIVLDVLIHRAPVVEFVIDEENQKRIDERSREICLRASHMIEQLEGCQAELEELHEIDPAEMSDRHLKLLECVWGKKPYQTMKECHGVQD